MGISLKRIVVACALALASATAMAQTVVVPSTIPETIPDGAGAAGGLVLTLFSNSADTPYSYSYNLGLTASQVSLLTSDMASDDKELTWNLPSLAPAGLTGDLRWHVTAGSTFGGSTSVPGNQTFLTTVNADYDFILGPVAGAPGSGNPAGYLQNTSVSASAQRFGEYVTNLNANAGNADISTNPADPFFQHALSAYGPSIAGQVQNAGLIGQALEFYFLTTVDNPNTAGQLAVGPGAATATRYQSSTGSIGHWLLNLDNDTLTWSVAPVPLPAAAWLLLSGLAGLGVISRRRAA